MFTAQLVRNLMRLGPDSESHNNSPSVPWLARLKRRARRYGLSDTESDDCVQDVCLALLQSHSDWDWHGSEAMAWGLTVVRNRAMDHHRRRHRSPCVALAEPDTIPSREPHDVIGEETDRNGRGQERLCRLHEELTGLSEINREILIRRAQGESYRQISVDVGLPYQIVKKRYQRILRILKVAMRSCVSESMDGDEGGGEALVLADSLTFHGLETAIDR